MRFLFAKKWLNVKLKEIATLIVGIRMLIKKTTL